MPKHIGSRGIAKGSLKQPESAIYDFDTAIHLKSDYASAYYNRGLAKNILGRAAEAKQDFLAALSLVETSKSDEGLKAKICGQVT